MQSVQDQQHPDSARPAGPVTLTERSGPAELAALLDNLGGAAISAPLAQRLAVGCASLRALDVLSAPQLTLLDLSDAAGAIHLTLRDCAALREIRLPVDGAGSVIHLDAGDTVPTLWINGRVRHIDACHAGGDFLLSNPDGYWQDAVLTRAEAIDGQPAAGLMVVVPGGEIPSTLRLRLPQQTRALALVSPSSESLNLRGPHSLALVQARRAPSLREIGIEGTAVATLQLQRCPSVTSIRSDAPVGSAHLNDRTGADALRIDARCESIIIADSGIRSLEIRHPSNLSLMRCSRLDGVSLPNGTNVACEGHVPPSLIGVTRVFMDEALMLDLTRRLRAGEPAWNALRSLVPKASHPRYVTSGLRALLSVMETGAIDGREVWAARNRLREANQAHGHHRRPEDGNQRGKQLLASRWMVDRDLILDAHRLDLHLWALASREDADLLRLSTAWAQWLAHDDLIGVDIHQQLMLPGVADSAAIRKLLTESLKQATRSSGAIPKGLITGLPRLASLLDSAQEEADVRAMKSAARALIATKGGFAMRLKTLEARYADPQQRIAVRLELTALITAQDNVLDPDRQMSVQELKSQAQALLLFGQSPAGAVSHRRGLRN